MRVLALLALLSQLAAAGQDGAAGQVPGVAGRWPVECHANNDLGGRGSSGGAWRGWRAGRGRGRGGAECEPEIGRGDDAPTNLRGWRGGYRGRGGGSQAKRGGGPLNERQITSVINYCSELGQLARILEEQRGVLNHIHVTTAWVCLARIATRPPLGGGGCTERGEGKGIVASLLGLTRGVLHQVSERQIANVLPYTLNPASAP